MKVVSHGVLGLPLLMIGFAIFVVKQKEGQPLALFRQAQSLERSGNMVEARALYDRLRKESPGTPAFCQTLWKMASIEYLVSRDTEKAVNLLHNLMESCQGGALVGKSILMLADIYEFDLNDLERSNQLRREYIAMDSESEQFEQVLFKIGDVLFKQDRWVEARTAFEHLLSLDPSEEITAQTRLRMGVILQLNQDYNESLRYFEAVVQESRSPEFRLQARLGLIESYEFMEQLLRAVEVAQDIQSDEYPPELKNNIVIRLKQKKLHSDQ